jgi:hypothetical protein
MIHLHCHSHYSLLCGASSPGDLVTRAAALGQSALALTDLNALHGAVDFQKACDAAGIRAIHGAEITDDRAADLPTGDRPQGPPSRAGAASGADDDGGEEGNATAPPHRLVPGSLALILADRIPWSSVFLVTALFLLPGLLLGGLGAVAGTALALAPIHISNVEFSTGTLAVACMSVIIGALTSLLPLLRNFP